MRVVLLCLAVVLAFALNLWGCASTAAPLVEPASLRERLATEAHLFVTTADSAGVITARQKTADGWSDGLVDLALTSGDLVVGSDDDGVVTLGALKLAFESVAIPSTVVGHQARLDNIRLVLARPARIAPIWSGDDGAQLTTELALALSWVVSVEGTGLPLGAPALPPLPVTVQLTGDEYGVAAELRVRIAGDMWSWADLVKLSDLALVLRARTAAR